MKDSDQHTHIHHQTQGTNFAGVLLGMAIGAVVTYLFANREGQKVRDHILKEGTRLLDEVSQKAHELEEKAQSVTEEMTEELEEKLEEVPEHIEQIQKKGRRFFFRRHHSPES